MARRTWLSVTVELLGGRGEEVWPPPGRVLAVGPSHTFMDLADAINAAFARWDIAHLSRFTLADGRDVTDQESAEETNWDPDGPEGEWLDIFTTRVATTAQPGAQFRYVFDFGDNWTHRCTVGPEKIDPTDEVGIRPKNPTAYFGWGSIPDQYGRRWDADDGESRLPPRPAQPDPMLDFGWPEAQRPEALDMTKVRAAIATRDAVGFLDAVIGRDLDQALHQVGAGVPMALEQHRRLIEPLARVVVDGLTERGAAGDDVLAEDLGCALRGDALSGRAVPVDLGELSSVLEGDPSRAEGGLIDLHTGEVLPDVMTDPAMVGADQAVDLEEDPDRWLRVHCTGSRSGWRDMAEFAARQRDAGLVRRLEQALEGRGAFRRFRDVVHEEGLVEPWNVFSTDREHGRARAYLASEGIRAWDRWTPPVHDR